MGTRIFEFYTSHEYEREKWKESLNNTFKTCKDMKNSITFQPRNICKLVNIIENEGLGSLKSFIEEEINQILQKNLM